MKIRTYRRGVPERRNGPVRMDDSAQDHRGTLRRPVSTIVADDGRDVARVFRDENGDEFVVALGADGSERTPVLRDAWLPTENDSLFASTDLVATADDRSPAERAAQRDDLAESPVVGEVAEPEPQFDVPEPPTETAESIDVGDSVNVGDSVDTVNSIDAIDEVEVETELEMELLPEERAATASTKPAGLVPADSAPPTAAARSVDPDAIADPAAVQPTVGVALEVTSGHDASGSTGAVRRADLAGFRSGDAIVDDKTLDYAMTHATTLNEGARATGTIVAVTSDNVVQNGGRGTFYVHPRDAFYDAVPKPGESVTIANRNGAYAVMDDVRQRDAPDREIERGGRAL